MAAACAAVPSRPPSFGQPTEQERVTLTPVAFNDVPGWTTDDVTAALPAFAQSCAVLAKKSPSQTLGVAGPVENWQTACANLPRTEDGSPINSAAARIWFEHWFRPYAVSGSGGTDGLFTGYYEPELRAARTQGGAYQTPIYRLPDDLVTVDLGQFRDSLKGQTVTAQVVGHHLRPYPDRAAIAAGALAQKDDALFWGADPVDVFFLEIQGSGLLRMPDGSAVQVGYAGQNGHSYVPIGQTLVARGFLAKDEVTMPAIRAWLSQHPQQMRSILDSNPSVTFFHEVAGANPVGAEGVALTPGRSIAIDKDLLPLGVPLFIDTTDPLDNGKPLQRLMIAQDTGGAIKGAVRADIFWGAGNDAAERAGIMKQHGRYFILLPRAAAGDGADSAG